MIQRKSDLELNNIIDVDSYKFSHAPCLYPSGMRRMFSYFESRGGEFETATIFGLQYMLHRYLAKPFDMVAVNHAAKFAEAHGEPFNRDGWAEMWMNHNGQLPVRIRAIPEGLQVPTGNVLLTVESTDERFPWLVNWLETQLSRVWYPSTICALSREAKRTWLHYLTISSDDPEAEVSFKHHDFGSRGVSCREQAMLGGAAHLVSFLGSDTIAGIEMANHYYDCEMAGFSIPATEHSTMTIFGKAHERDALRTWVQKTLMDRQLPPGVPKLTACVGDSYDIHNFVKEHVCSKEIRQMIESSGGTLVVRPDSGDPLKIIPELLGIFEHNLPFGAVKVNSKGFKVLPPYLRMIWGDGIDRHSQPKILAALLNSGWSASNLAMGSGGGLLMKVDRDLQKFAFKCSEVDVDGESIDVRKDPVTDPGKRSKAGRLDLILHPDGQYDTIRLAPGEIAHERSVMETIFEDGKIMRHMTMDQVRANSAGDL